MSSQFRHHFARMWCSGWQHTVIASGGKTEASPLPHSDTQPSFLKKTTFESAAGKAFESLLGNVGNTDALSTSEMEEVCGRHVVKYNSVKCNAEHKL